MEHAGKDTIFRDVHLFVERVKDIAAVKGDELVRQNLSTCLKGMALTWYTSELIPDQKRLLKLGHGIEEWEQKLVARFKERPNIAMATIVQERYTMLDARNRREPRKYAGVITRAAKSAELGTTAHIMMLIYNGLDLEFQRDLPTPSLTTLFEQFLQQLDDRKDIWWGLALRAGKPNNNPFYATSAYRNLRNPYYNMAPNYSKSQSRFVNNPGQASAQSSSRQLPRRDDINYTPQSETNPEQTALKQIEAPKKKLLITAGAPSGSDLQYNQPEQNNTRNQYNPYRTYGSKASPSGRGSPRGYQNRNWRQQGKVQGNYFGDPNASDEPCNEGRLDNTGNKEGDIEQETSQAEGASGEHEAGDDNHEEYGYHTGSAIVSHAKRSQCKNCLIWFPSNNRLHKHLRSCTPHKRLTYTKKIDDTRARLGVAPVIEARLGGIPVIESTAEKSTSTGLAFRSWHFATFIAQLTHNGPLDDLCGDTGCTMSLIDRQFLKTKAPQAMVRRCDVDITVRGIGSRTHACSEYAIVTILIPGLVDGKPARASITHQLHIVDELKAKVLVGMDILGPEQAIVDIGRRKLILPTCRNLTTELTVTPKRQ